MKCEHKQKLLTSQKEVLNDLYEEFEFLEENYETLENDETTQIDLIENEEIVNNGN